MRSAPKHHVYAPLIPGYGDSEEAPEIRDMLDFTLPHLGRGGGAGPQGPDPRRPFMGGMIAAEMAAIAPSDVTRLALIAPAGLWDDAHPVVDMFSTLPFEMPNLLFHDAEAGAAILTAGRNVEDPASCNLSGDQRAPARHGGTYPLPDPRAGGSSSASTDQGEDRDRLG